jgi:nitrate/TMAO reductase-like tetraheme cytochrome c subunit
MNTPAATTTPLGRLFHNWISFAGMVLAASALFAFILLFAIDLMAENANPYLGILAYVVAPGFLFLGLLLVFLGAWLKRRQERRSGSAVAGLILSVDLSRPRDRKVLVGFLAGTVIFLLLTAFGSYETYHYTESVQFCGQACHVPMEPQFVAYQHTAHAKVACVECHVGSGAGAYLETKVNGVRQLACMVFGNFDRPIRAPREKLRTAQSTCEQCHWPEKSSGTVERTHHRFLADETNTPYTVRLLLNVGGGNPAHGTAGGIHWHMNLANKVEYLSTNDHAGVIPWVRLTTAKGEVTEFRAPGFKDDPAAHAIRTMDCMDCHNRPAHRFTSPNDAVDLALAAGQIDPAIPWVKSNLVAALVASYPTKPQALDGIASALRAAYPEHPRADALIAAAQGIYQRNFFPEMKADWRAYPEHISHKESAGCFRCHDGQHKTSDGKRTLGASNCNSCHVILAQGAGTDLASLSAKGHDFIHIDSPYSDFDCHKCHTGAFPRE